MATTLRFSLPGAPSRTMMDLYDGFSLIYALMLALTGGLGLIVVAARHPTIRCCCSRVGARARGRLPGDDS